MDFTPEEEKFLRPYLAMKIHDGHGWAIGLAIGTLICVAAVVIRVLGIWPDIGPYFLLIFVMGLVVIEQSVNYRDKTRLARILQKYDAIVRRMLYMGEDEDTI